MQIYIIILYLFFTLQHGNAQHIEFKKVDLPTTKNQVRIDTFNIYAETELENDIQWILAIKPRWTKIAGIKKNDKIHVTYVDSVSDGRLIRSHFYSSSINPKDFIIICIYGFEDGISYLEIFEYQNQTAKHLGSLNLLGKGFDEVIGIYGYYPEEQLSVSKVDHNLKLNFSEGEYIYLQNFKENIIEGPIEVVYKNNEFVIRLN